MKFFFLIFILLTGSKACDSRKPSNKNELPVVKSTSQAWSGGAEGSSRGVYYTIYLAMKNTDDYTFDSLWVQGERFALTKQKNFSTDTAVLRVNAVRNRFPNTADSTGTGKTLTIINFPIETSGEGVLSYCYKGLQKYFIIKSWIKLKPIFYP